MTPETITEHAKSATEVGTFARVVALTSHTRETTFKDAAGHAGRRHCEMPEERLSPEKETFVLSCANFLTLIGGAVIVNALMFTNPLALIPVVVLAVGAGFFGYAIGRGI